jgi:hypothetical protein
MRIPELTPPRAGLGNYELTARMKVVREYYNGPVILGQDLMAFEVGDQVKVINK